MDEIKQLICPVRRVKVPVKRIDKLICPVRRVQAGDDKYCSQTQDFLTTNEAFIHENMESYHQKEEIDNDVIEGLDDVMNANHNDLFALFKQRLKDTVVTIPNTYNYLSEYFASNTPAWEKSGMSGIGFIITGTGTGKTTYVKDLLEKGWNVLYLANRKMIVEQVKTSLKEFNNLSVMTYQELAINARYTEEYLNSFDIVIVDECHALQYECTYDPSFNVAYDLIIRANRTKRLFMSATADCILDRVLSDYRRILNNDIEFLKRISIICSNMKKVSVKKVYAFDDLDDLVKIITKSNHKWLLFVRSKTQGRQILSLLREAKVLAGFICREGLDDGDAMMKKIYESICVDKTFDFDVLITTRLSDCGISIEDENLKSIVLFEKNEICVRQELGRKRQISADDGIDVYISNDSASTINGLITQSKMTINRYKQMRQLLKRSRLPDPLIRNGKNNDEYRKAVFKYPSRSDLKFNWVGLNELKKDQATLIEMMRNNSTVDLVLRWIEKATGQRFNVENVLDHKQIFLDVITAYTGEKIERDKVIDFRRKITCDYLDCFGYENPHDRPSNPFSIKKINERLLLKGIPFRINNVYKGCASKQKIDGIVVTKLLCPVKRLN